MNEPELYRRFEAEFKALRNHPPMTITLTAMEAWALLSQVQLASRHAMNTGPTRDLAVGVAHRLQVLVAPAGALAEVARRGWFPEFDEFRN